MSMNDCILVTKDLAQDDADRVLDALDQYVAAGVPAAEAQRTAAADLIAAIEAQRQEIQAAVRAQLPELFERTPVAAAAAEAVEPEPFQSQFFGPSQARRLEIARNPIDDPVVPETPEFARSRNGELARMPKLKGLEDKPIVVRWGEVRGDHRGFGFAHAIDNMRYMNRKPPSVTGDMGEDWIRTLTGVLREATQVFEDGGRYLLYAPGRKAAAVVQDRGDVYSVVTMIPMYKPRNGGLVGVVQRREERPRLAAARILEPAPLYVDRPVANAQDIFNWAISSGIKDVVPPEKLHVTLAYSRQPVDTKKLPPAAPIAPVVGGARSVQLMGDDGAVALRFESDGMQARWQQILNAGGTWDHGHSLGSFKPHVTVSYTKQDLPAGIQPYTGPIVFGPERQEDLKSDWSKTIKPAQARQTDTPEFKRWFGDSQVVNADGGPMVVYHGTRSDVLAFSEEFFGDGDGRADWGDGFYFASNPAAAGAYARGDGGNVMPVYLSLKNPADRAVMSTREVRDALDDGYFTTARDVLTRMGYDGIAIDHGADGKEFVAFRPEQIKSAVGNRGSFDPESQAVTQARSFEDDMNEQRAWLDAQAQQRGFEDIDALADADFDGFMRLAEEWRNEHPMEVAQARQGAIALPTFGAGSMIVEALQNRYNRWKQVVDSVRGQGGVVTEANDFYSAEERYWGKVASRMEDFDQEVQRFTEEVVKDGLDFEALQLYAYAKHAKERNAYLRTKRAAGNGGFEDWSGMSDDDADAIIDDAAQSGLQPLFEKHHATLMSWTQGTRDLMLDEGLIDQNQYLMLSGFYDNYVPLRGKKGMEGRERRGTGAGFSIRGAETKRAKGRYSMADNIIENIIQDRTRALVRAGKNEVLRSFLQFVLDNPAPDLWRVNAVEMRPTMTRDDQGNLVIEEQPKVIKDDTTIGIKDGGREVSVQILDEPLRAQLKNLNVEGVSKAIGLMLAAQRMLGRLYTSLNPVFTVLNWFRDLQTGTFGMLQEVGAKGAAKLWLNIPGAMVEAARAEFSKPSVMYQEFRVAGGKTGFMDFKDIETLAKDLTDRVSQAQMSGMDPRWWGPKSLDLIESINAVIENSTRFAAYKVSREDGNSMARSASISKNLTVNFNRKGTWAPQLGAWFLFFNPAVQGSVRVAQALKSPKVMAALGASMTGIAMLALQNASAGEDDDGTPWWDKIPQEVKDRNLIIVLPAGVRAGEPIDGSREGRYIKIPMPYGWNWFATISNQAVDLWRNSVDPAHGVTPSKAFRNVLSSFLGAYAPVQELGRSIQTPESAVLAGIPDFLNAPAQAVMNLNAFGRQMYPDDARSREMPDSARYFPGQAGNLFQATAEGLNAATGGSRYQSGWLDFTPASIENFVRAYGGGPASFALDLANAWYVRQSIQRPDMDVRRLPFAKQLYGRIDAETDRMLAYDRMDEIRGVTEPIERARREGDIEEARRLQAEEPGLARLGGALQTTRERLSRMRKEELAIIASEDSDAAKYARLTALDDKKRKALQDLNRAYAEAVRRAAPVGATQ